MIDIENYFSATVTDEDVSEGKPNPEVFLKAADKLSLPGCQCVIFEDAPAGTEAGRAAGMMVVGLSTTHPPELLKAADRVIQRLGELSIEEITRWCQSENH